MKQRYEIQDALYRDKRSSSTKYPMQACTRRLTRALEKKEMSSYRIGSVLRSDVVIVKPGTRCEKYGDDL